jgi:type II secretory pathway pseudopilin PulG
MSPPRRGFTLVETLLAMAVLFLMGATLFVVLAPVREKARQATCLSNLHQIGQALMLYVNDHPGGGCQNFYGLPPDPESLYPRYVSDPSVFRCPNSAVGGGYAYQVWKGRDPYYIAPLRRWSLAPDWCQLYNQLGDDFPLMFDMNHTTLKDIQSGFRYWIVLFRGGQVERVITDRRVASTDLRPRHAVASATQSYGAGARERFR